MIYLQKTHKGFVEGDKVTLHLPQGPTIAIVTDVKQDGLGVVQKAPLAQAIRTVLAK